MSCLHGDPVPEYHPKIVSEYGQEITQSQTADNPMAPRARAAQLRDFQLEIDTEDFDVIRNAQKEQCVDGCFDDPGSGGVAEPRNNAAMIYAEADGSRCDGARNVNIDVGRQVETQQQSVQHIAGGSHCVAYYS